VKIHTEIAYLVLSTGDEEVSVWETGRVYTGKTACKPGKY